MSDVESSEFDRGVQRAWARYRSHLADRIAAIGPEDQLILESTYESDDIDGRVPFVQCQSTVGTDGIVVRCEIPDDLLLPPHRRLTGADAERLVELGWTRPARDPLGAGPDVDDGPAFFVEQAPRWADRLAAMAVSVFRDTWGVPHPAFLDTQSFGDDLDVEWQQRAESVVAERPALDRHVAIQPRDTPHLRELIALTLTDLHGRAPEVDADGDIILRFGSALALVIANESTPEVQLWAPLVRDISGRTRASELITDLNRRWPYLRFALFEDRLRVMIDMLADPFVPQHLIEMVEHLSDFLSGVDEEFAAHFGGCLHFTPAQAVPADDPSAPDTKSREQPHGDATVVPDAFGPERDTTAEQTELFDDPVQPSLFDDPEDF
ncbi:hypothetical protein [Rhodococcus sp. ABRD24]|uniref:T3SS (YopN, CesT) and YbjN peptide-binding chaperone 1 n=1 Tax=Rhodococcus sp. ABRD24 TaxID=2507582 RepID=UPI001F601F19|nr:hypothetical protein [Rhodococcus sp. ABRD24]